jgi:octaprenyl-diphosphate synthase
MIYGNAASIYAGDWLLVQALMRIQKAGIEGLTDKMLVIINDMVHAESLQLDNRGRINSSFDDYFKVVEGKTAALFRWALYAGARVGGLDEAECQALETYGLHLGIAFQAVDDILDVDGDAQVTGKALFTDLREGKMTYPLLKALERDKSITASVEECAQKPAELPLPPEALQRVLAALHNTGAIEACRDFAAQHSRKAVAALADIRCAETATALTTIAQATTFRKH